ncbi:MAG: endonuclease [Micropepsaceae bacterium]
MAHTWRSRFAAIVTLFALAGCADSGPDAPILKAAMAPLPVHASVAPYRSWEKLAELPWPQGGQRTYQNYEEARRIFWKKLYPAGGTDLYCGVSFDSDRSAAPIDDNLSVEHVYPADAIAETEPGCTNRTCSAARVQRAMADLQNLWPALQKVNSSRSRLRYGTLAQTVKPRFPEVCPSFRRGIGTQAVVEPRDEVKGDVARSIIYMHFVYGLPLEDAVSEKQLLLDWMAKDPPDVEELRRNTLIDSLQGTTNPLLEAAFMGM